MFNILSRQSLSIVSVLLFNIFSLYSQELQLTASKTKACVGDVIGLSLDYDDCTSVTWQYSSTGVSFSSFSNKLSTSNTYNMDKSYCFRAMGVARGLTKYSNVVCVDVLENYKPSWYYGSRKMVSGEELDFCGPQSNFEFNIIKSVLNEGKDQTSFQKNFRSEWKIDGVLFSNDFDIVVPLFDKDANIVHTISSDYCSDVVFEFNFNIIDYPELEISTATPVVCKGSEAKIDISYSGDVTKTLLYEGGKTSPISSEFGKSFSFTPNTTGLYYAEVYTKEGCGSKSDYVKVEIENPYTPSWSRGSVPFRNGDVLDFCGDVVDFSFNLFGPNFKTDKDEFMRNHTSEWYIDGVKVSDDFNYVLHLLTKSGVVTHRISGKACPAQDFIFNMNVQPTPAVRLSAEQTEICEGTDLTLDIDYDTNTKSLSVFQKTSAGPKKVSDNLSRKLTLSPENDAVYWIEAYNGDCKSVSDEVEVSVLPGVSVQVQAPKSNVCEGDDVSALAIVSKGNPKSIVWSKDGQAISSSKELSDTPQKDAVYKIEVNNGKCPSFSQTYQVKVESVDFRADDVTVCEGENASVRATATSGSKFRWYDSSDRRNLISSNAVLSVSPSQTTEYFLTVESASGVCKAEGSAFVKVNPLPQVVDYSEIGSSTYKLDIEGGTGKILVDFGNGSEPSTSNVLQDAEPDRVYHVTLTDEKGCTSSFDMETNTFELEIPKYFVANRESWVIKNVDKFKKCRLSIYDRFGRMIYTSDSPANGWNGVFNGNDMPSTDYWFVLDIEDRDKQVSGHFTLLRD